MTEDQEKHVLDPEIIDNIQSFSGEPREESMAESILNSGRSLQRTQTAYTTAVAVQKPRSFTRFVNNCMEEAKLAGSAFYYRWEVFDKQKGRKVPIEGESIDMSMCLARNFGNDVVDVDVTETLSHYLFKGVFIDLETGFTAPRLFRQRKTQSISGKMDAERQEDIVFQIGQSKAIRNAIVRAMPKWLRDQMIDAAKGSELSKIKPENIHIARAKVMDFFGKYGVTQDRIEKERNKKADEWGPQDIVDLRGMATAVKEGRISPDDLFPSIPTEKAQDASQSTNGEKQEESTGEPEPPPTESLFEYLKKMRPSTSIQNMEAWKYIITENANKIRSFIPDEYEYITKKWLKACPGDPFPARPLTDYDEPPPSDDEPVTDIVDNGGEKKDMFFINALGFSEELGPDIFFEILSKFHVGNIDAVPVNERSDFLKACSRKLDEEAAG